MTTGGYAILDDITEACTLPAAYYRDDRALSALKESVFSRTWQWIGFEQQCPEPGCLHPVTLLPGWLDEPLLLSRDAAGTLHVLSNVCTHRGNILVAEPCRSRDITCGYHGRRFALDGRVLSMPLFQEAKNFPGASDHLPSLPLKRLGPLLFTALNAPQTFDDVFAPLMERIAWLDLQALHPRPDLSALYRVKAHWALYVENYLEGFHIPFVHKGLNSALDFKDYQVDILPGMVLQIAPASRDDEGFPQPEARLNGRPLAALYFWVWPNLMLNFYPWGLSLNLVIPQDTEHTLVAYHTFVSDESRMGRGAGADLHRVEMEDQAVVEQVQQGIRSRLYSQGRYSPRMETGTHYFHRLLARAYCLSFSDSPHPSTP